jgi:pimeloyl-ACP methyl ester carboxylesterase
VPLLLLAGAKDEVVPHQQMMDIWASFRAGAAPEVMRRSRLEKCPGGGHNTTWMIPGYYSRIEQWLALFPGMQSSD